jgi:hypothetical protein
VVTLANPSAAIAWARELVSLALLHRGQANELGNGADECLEELCEILENAVQPMIELAERQDLVPLEKGAAVEVWKNTTLCEALEGLRLEQNEAQSRRRT